MSILSTLNPDTIPWPLALIGGALAFGGWLVMEYRARKAGRE